jgi:peptide/nickel transport system permease protein
MATAPSNIQVLRSPAPIVSLPQPSPTTRRAFSEKTLFQLGVLLTLAWVGVALLAPWIAPYSPLQGDAALAKGGIAGAHLFGLDKYGRDILSRVVYGSRYDLCIAITAVGLALVIGTVIGSTSGALGGKIDNLIA